MNAYTNENDRIPPAAAHSIASTTTGLKRGSAVLRHADALEHDWARLFSVRHSRSIGRLSYDFLNRRERGRTGKPREAWKDNQKNREQSLHTTYELAPLTIEQVRRKTSLIRQENSLRPRRVSGISHQEERRPGTAENERLKCGTEA